MNFCTNCGAERVVGRFCTNCGAPTTSEATPAGDTAERPAVGRAAPPAVERSAERTSERPAVRAGITPCSRRRRTPGSSATAAATRSTPTRSTPPPTPAAAPPTAHRDDRARSLPLWLPVLAVLVVLAMVVGVWMLTRDGGSGDTAADEPTSDTPSASQPTESDPVREKPTRPPPGAGRQPDRPRGSTPPPPGRSRSHPARTSVATRWPTRPRTCSTTTSRRRTASPATPAARRWSSRCRRRPRSARSASVNGYAKKDSERVPDRRLVPPEPQDPQGRVGLRRRHHRGAGPARRAGAADHRRRQGAHQHDLAADPRGVRLRGRRDEQERDRDQRRPAPRRPLTLTDHPADVCRRQRRGNAHSESRAPHANGHPSH